MKEIYLNSIQQVNDLYGVSTLHPLVSVVHLNRRIEQPDAMRYHILARVKQWLNDESLSIAIVSERLGFEYPQHFNRFFKRHTGLTPTQYRKVI